MELTYAQIARIAREHTVSPAERRAQRVSLIAGLRSHNSTLTRERVTELVDQLEGHDPLQDKNPK